MTLARGKPLESRTGLQRSAFKTPGGVPFSSLRTSPLPRSVPFRSVPGDKSAARTRKPLKAVSAKRAAENRERRAMVGRLYPERPHCARPSCPRMADDLHEPLTRARGGSITDEANQVPLCRPCHDEITFRPESELQWAYDAGLLVHSWDAVTSGGDA
jgi:hypothetical protein